MEKKEEELKINLNKICTVCRTPQYLCECGPLNALAKQIATTVKSRGFVTPVNLKDHNAVLAKLMLVVRELSEAVEEVRKPEQSRKAFDEEICDVFIRLFDICGAMKINLDGGIAAKELKNSQRKFRHGKVC